MVQKGVMAHLMDHSMPRDTTLIHSRSIKLVFTVLLASPAPARSTKSYHRHSAMASSKISGLSSLILLLLLLVISEPGVAIILEPDTTSRHFPPLADCAPAPPAPSKNDSAFRANVLSLLGVLPAATAAASTGFAATRSSGAGRDRAFARGLCFGASARGSSPGDCLGCLSAAAEDVLASECRGSRRAGLWRAGCFLSYADTNTSSAREDAYHGWFYDDVGGEDSPAAALGSQCAGDRTAAGCSRCLNESAGVVPALKEWYQFSRVRGHAVVVVGYDCYLRVQLEDPSPRWRLYSESIYSSASWKHLLSSYADCYFASKLLRT